MSDASELVLRLIDTSSGPASFMELASAAEFLRRESSAEADKTQALLAAYEEFVRGRGLPFVSAWSKAELSELLDEASDNLLEYTARPAEDRGDEEAQNLLSAVASVVALARARHIAGLDSLVQLIRFAKHVASVVYNSAACSQLYDAAAAWRLEKPSTDDTPLHLYDWIESLAASSHRQILDNERKSRAQKRDIRQVKVEITAYCDSLPWYVLHVYEVYVTDMSVRHFCCSAQPMAYCIAVRTEIVVNNEVPDELLEEIQKVELEHSFDSDYFEYEAIASLPFVAFEDDTDDTDAEAVEAAREYFQGNHI